MNINSNGYVLGFAVGVCVAMSAALAVTANILKPVQDAAAEFDRQKNVMLAAGLVVEGDPRVPSPQSVELHMGLKRVGVPTELFMYPGASHGIPDARNRLVKSTAEMAWMDYYVLGKGTKFSWREVLKTLEDPKAEKKVDIKGP